MKLTTTRRLALVGALLLAVSCSVADDLTDLAENTTPAPAEATTSPEPSPTAALPQETATVVRIIDGDTFDVRFTDGRTERIRPPQFDAPERGLDRYAHEDARLAATYEAAQEHARAWTRRLDGLPRRALNASREAGNGRTWAVRQPASADVANRVSTHRIFWLA